MLLRNTRFTRFGQRFLRSSVFARSAKKSKKPLSETSKTRISLRCAGLFSPPLVANDRENNGDASFTSLFFVPWIGRQLDEKATVVVEFANLRKLALCLL